MQRIFLISLLTLAMAAGTAMAQEYGSGQMMDGRGMHYGQGHMSQGQGMMHDDMGYGGWMRGPGMMRHGQGDCQSMMAGGGMMMGPGGMGLTSDQRQEFLNDTVKLRKSLHMLHFEYMEARRNPKTTLEELGNMEQKMLDMRKKMMKKIDTYRTQQ